MDLIIFGNSPAGQVDFRVTDHKGRTAEGTLKGGKIAWTAGEGNAVMRTIGKRSLMNALEK